MLAANGMNQATLSERLGLKRSTMSIKLAGRSSWSVPNLVETAYILNTTPQALMDDTFMTRMEKMRSSEQKPSELPVAESMIQDEQGKKKSEE
ncbi:helix-turn-helix transcriptional regulator [Bifidobacterium thermacidophilum]|uniref:Helix-turn-helix transcriptional regulator n=1 Tax=Bifidobacterium thermacidophilum TaxID=246618 RepID=A0ABW8KQF4_9BIFI